jgi:4-aminobutyrate aminotransferase-like enzyme
MSSVAAAKGDFLLGELERHLAPNPRVAEIRGRGLMVGIELSDDDGCPLNVAKRVSDESVRQGSSFIRAAIMAT